ncbi:hypothetical protein CNEO3_240024 [Clostridium neonatale]|nr:hypothetical protein CNEO3_240024 [Clostridium neonatale]
MLIVVFALTDRVVNCTINIVNITKSKKMIWFNRIFRLKGGKLK